MAGWYYARDNVQKGPVPLNTLRALVARGELGPDDLVWRDGMGDWLPVSQVPAVTAPPETSMGAPLDLRGHPTQQVGGFTQPTLQYYGERRGGSYVDAGFWYRFGAAFLDGIILAIGGCCIAGIVTFLLAMTGMYRPAARGRMRLETDLMGDMIGLIIRWLYYALMESSVQQASLGKMAIGLVVTDLEGNRITFGRATGRFFAKILSFLTLGIGFMMAGWTERKQALHDLIAGTRVMRKV